MFLRYDTPYASVTFNFFFRGSTLSKHFDVVQELQEKLFCCQLNTLKSAGLLCARLLFSHGREMTASVFEY